MLFTMYSICFKSVRDHPCDAADTFLKYISSLQLGTIHRIRRISNVHQGCHLFVHYSWFEDELLRRELDQGIPKTFILGTGVNQVWFDMVKTSIPSDMVHVRKPATPLRNTSVCRIV